ncbi:GIY-YIG nuclease family protein [Thiocapsa sp. UBA6158]|jgi:hypothetical protein|uniref:GIY-YIG nuclease family protein n=1 Tax=Thiocapsa sp. UBA6158 TaxID=1947692 RepID=UPI0025E94CDE|nr:GIY-YIG nuclease family protein [Thiocapsa sp. UBA6158]
MTFKPLNMPSTGMGMVYLTPEQRRANGLKAAATKRARKEAEERGRAEARDRIVGLKDEIEELERQRGALQMQQLASVEAARLTGKTLLTEGAIVKGAMAWAKVCGIYFLVREGRVVYVGQSIDVFGRISTHHQSKTFDAIAYVSCERHLLDKMESLYIHVLQPPLNGDMRNGAKLAPLALDELLSA